MKPEQGGEGRREHQCEARRAVAARLRLKVKTPMAETAAPPAVNLGVYYFGSRRMPDLPDGREVWQARVGGEWRTYYEVPLDATEARIIARRASLRGDR